MVDLPTVSIIVPAYNAESTIAECIAPLLALDYPGRLRELLVVNNASTDATGQVLKQFGSEIVSLSEVKRGPSAARNRGLRAARREVVAFTDADCVVDRGWLRSIVLPLRDQRVGVVGGRTLARRPCNEIEAYGERIHDQGRSINEFTPPYVSTANWSSRLSLLKDVGLFDEALTRGEDVDLSWRILQLGYRLVYEPDAVIYHRHERSLPGLFQEGYLHGYHAPRIHKKHRALLGRFGIRRWRAGGHLVVLRSVVDYIMGRDPTRSICHAMFNLGKRIGKLVGSVRWGYPEL
jgi:cellulose synthase/poly-beta-1,6-N-acetylglucosamine synthase-like glycosyltransferase